MGVDHNMTVLTSKRIYTFELAAAKAKLEAAGLQAMAIKAQ